MGSSARAPAEVELRGVFFNPDYGIFTRLQVRATFRTERSCPLSTGYSCQHAVDDGAYSGLRGIVILGWN